MIAPTHGPRVVLTLIGTPRIGPRGFRVKRLTLRVWSVDFKHAGFGFRVFESGFRIQGLVFKV